MTRTLHYEYLALVMHRYNTEKEQWTNARVEAENHYDSPFNRTGKRVCDTEEEARKFIDWEVNHFKPIGKTKEISRKAGMVGYSFTLNLEDQTRQEIVKVLVKRREVTDFEIVEEDTIA